MTANQIVYAINNHPRMSARWHRLDLPARRDFLAYCQNLRDERELPKLYADWRKEKKKK